MSLKIDYLSNANRVALIQHILFNNRASFKKKKKKKKMHLKKQEAYGNSALNFL